MRLAASIIIALLPSICLAATSYGPGTKYAKNGGTPQGQQPSNIESLQESKASGGTSGLDETPPTVPANGHEGGPIGTNDCGTTTFSDLYDPKAPIDNYPLVEDCRELIKKVTSGNHEWVFGPDEREITRAGTCGFFMKTTTKPGKNKKKPPPKAVVGNGDVLDLVTDSINQFTHSGSVSVSGTYTTYVTSTGGLSCDDENHDFGVAISAAWTIRKTNKKKGGKDEDETGGNDGT